MGKLRNKNEEIVGNEWFPATTKPRQDEIVKLRRVRNNKTEMGDLMALLNGEKYYIFNLQTGKWEDYCYFFAYSMNKETPAPLEDFEYSYIDPLQTRYIPFYALAHARRRTISEHK